MRTVRPVVSLLLALALLLGALISSRAQGERSAERAAMIETIQAHAAYAPEALGGGTIDPAVLQVMAEIPRHAFVPEDVQAEAYRDAPLPIGYGQTISQPFIVAFMTDVADVGAGDRVLEIGTGSGYQAAVLSRLVAEVYSIEIVPELGERARTVLQDGGFANVQTRIGDGYYGWPEAAPFDAIVVTAAASHVPPPLIEQLKPGGRMIIPVGGPFAVQYLLLVEKEEQGGVTTRQLLPVTFVPLVGGEGD